MELQEFISKALSEIAVGIAQGRENAAEHGVIIGQALYGENLNAVSTSRKSHPAIPEYISFDVAVTSSAGGGAQAGIHVFGFSLGEVEGKLHNETVSRISFRVPVHWEQPCPVSGFNVVPIHRG